MITKKQMKLNRTETNDEKIQDQFYILKGNYIKKNEGINNLGEKSINYALNELIIEPHLNREKIIEIIGEDNLWVL